jgi:transposase
LIYDQGNGSLAEVAEQFCVSVARAWKFSSARKRTGKVERPTYRPGPKPRIDEQAVAELLRVRRETTLPELQVDLEKKSLYAQERDAEANRHRREQLVATLSTIAPEKLIFLDESGVSTQMTRLHARCRGGARIHEGTPDSRWQILTILGALSTRGMIAAMTIVTPTDREIFLAYLDEVLCPQLQAGDVVVMDNLGSDKVDGVRQRIEKCGAALLYLPPSSPDLNPIEKVWSKLKQLLRTEKAAPRKPSKRPSPNCFRSSPHRTQKPGSGSLLPLYSNTRDALNESSFQAASFALSARH